MRYSYTFRICKETFPDSEIVQDMGCAASKATQIANPVGKVDNAEVITEMRQIPFTLTTDESNDYVSDKLVAILVTTVPVEPHQIYHHVQLGLNCYHLHLIRI